MGGFRKPETSRDQLVMWEKRLDEAIPKSHPVRMLDELLRAPHLTAMFREWESDYVLVEGKPPYHPRYLVALYLYGMLSRLRSSRQLEEACYNRLDVIWLMSGQRPDHSTIAGFVKKHHKRLRQLFREVVKTAVMAGLVPLNLVAIDGTTIEADASKRSVKTAEGIEQLIKEIDKKIDELETEWQANEQTETLLFGDTLPWQPKPEAEYEKQLRQLREAVETLKHAKANIERRASEARKRRPPKAINSTTDPDSRVMKDKEGRRKCSYNAQLAVDAESGVIVGMDVNDKASDSGQLGTMVEEVRQTCEGNLPKAVAADSAYNTGADLKTMEEIEVTAYLPGNNARGFDAQDEKAQAACEAVKEGRQLSEEELAALPRRKDLFAKEAFAYDEETDTYRCPAGNSLPRRNVRSGESKYGPAPECGSCPLASQCHKGAKGRTVQRDEYDPHRDRLRQRMAEPESREVYRRRAPVVESRFGIAKRGLGFCRFLRRGLEGTTAEWLLLGTALNIRVIFSHWQKVEEAAIAW